MQLNNEINKETIIKNMNKLMNYKLNLEKLCLNTFTDLFIPGIKRKSDKCVSNQLLSAMYFDNSSLNEDFSLQKDILIDDITLVDYSDYASEFYEKYDFNKFYKQNQINSEQQIRIKKQRISGQKIKYKVGLLNAIIHQDIDERMELMTIDGIADDEFTEAEFNNFKQKNGNKLIIEKLRWKHIIIFLYAGIISQKLSISIRPDIFKKIENDIMEMDNKSSKVIELFGSPINSTLRNYCSAFAFERRIIKDNRKPIDNARNFLINEKFDKNTLVMANPPYIIDIIEDLVSQVLYQVRKRQITIMMMLPIWDNEDQKRLNRHDYGSQFEPIRKIREEQNSDNNIKIKIKLYKDFHDIKECENVSYILSHLIYISSDNKNRFEQIFDKYFGECEDD